MNSKVAQFLLSVLLLLHSLVASARLTTPPLPDFSGHDLAPLSVADDTAELATFGDAIDNVVIGGVPKGARVVVVVFSDEPEGGYIGIVDRSNNGVIWILYEGKLPLGLYELEVIGGKLSARHKNQSTWTDISLLHGLGYDLSSIQKVLEHWECTHSDLDGLTVAAIEARFAPINQALFASVESDSRFVPGDSEGIAWLRQRLDDRKALTVLHPERGRRAYGALTRHVAGSAAVMLTTGLGTGTDVSPEAAYLYLSAPTVSPRKAPSVRPRTQRSTLRTQAAQDLSKNNLKHLAKHLEQFRMLDPTMELGDIIRLGDAIMSDSASLASRAGAKNQFFQAVVDVGGESVLVRVVLNRVGKMNSVHIRPE